MEVNNNGKRLQHLLTSSEAAEFLRVKPNILAEYRMTGEGPIYIKQSARRILYRRDDLETWLNKRTFQSTAAATVSGI
ncbi:helix-turn-helix domain-containing protein [Paenochrobactrum pullorum]|uniref:helix-turn-helix domain-containing protein n=1 Tax=Paenochrobactrum pullorum TaxID=1324351 RepID=UPI0035BBB15A